MAHALYTTPALVLGSLDTKDADKAYWLLTHDFGLIIASAKSVREEVSKLRYALADLAHARVTLVRGRAGWRLTGAEQLSPPLSHEHQVVFGRIAVLARRLLPTDEVHVAVYELLHDAYMHLVHTQYLKESETLTVARLLYMLGYLSCTPAYRGLVDTAVISEDALARTTALLPSLIEDINGGLAQSQL